MYPNKSFIEKVLEGAALFALACWLVKTGVCMIQSVWGWIMLLLAITGVAIVGFRFYKHYKDNHF